MSATWADAAATWASPLVVVDGATVAATTPLEVLNELGADGWEMCGQSSWEVPGAVLASATMCRRVP